MRPPADPRPFYKSLVPLLPWRELAHPCDWARIFGRVAPLELEIGTGSGDYVSRLAATRPDVDFVGIDQRWASVKRTLRNLAQAGATNARLLLDDARPILERAFAPRSLTRIHVLFPCPWRKEKHEKHRLFRADFLRLVRDRLAVGGELLCVTDWKPFLDWTLAQLPGTGFRPEWQLIPPGYGTKYERKWLGQGQREFFEIRLVREDDEAARGAAPEAAPPQPEMTVNPHHLPAFDPARFEPQDDVGALSITFKETVKDLERGVVMVRAVIIEDSLTQNLWLVIARGKEGGWWIVPARGCQMIPTLGVQRALDRLKEAVVASAAPTRTA